MNYTYDNDDNNDNERDQWWTNRKYAKYFPIDSLVLSYAE